MPHKKIDESLELARDGKGWKFRATGLYAVCILSAYMTYSIISKGDLANSPNDLVLAILATFVSGIALGFAVMNGRVADALDVKEQYRKEVNRLAQAKRILEEKSLKKRGSSKRKR